MDNSVIAKSGWLLRQTTILKKWKWSWVELYRDGQLKYYENEHSPNAEDIILMTTDCLAIKTGSQVEGVQPPEGRGIQYLFSVVASSGKTWIFCGESLDDMRAWQLALEQARLFGIQPRTCGQPPPYLPYSPGYLPAYTGDSSLTYVQPYPYPQTPYYPYLSAYGSPQVQNPLVYQPQRYYRPDGTDMAMGMLAGTALGTMMWGPVLWW
ncbi:pleckstrin homology domain-containing family B member 2-like isoform X1 [Limulus polyphemus]|uniref:Pleckstrin homology domain-containing family B member 2-like isoform X1 n=1 Tax=Limulus polyphemus TaxID=6850 RepID=A0ABM1BAP8_LIMPO|nr:pleckstrin homology domain-containing family B member 2-like isoform X1 [Limulus polyphemus]